MVCCLQACSLFCRRKRQVWGIAVASVAGATAAYYAYMWYTSTPKPPKDAAEDAAGVAEAPPMSQQLEAHMASLQVRCNATSTAENCGEIPFCAATESGEAVRAVLPAHHSACASSSD